MGKNILTAILVTISLGIIRYIFTENILIPVWLFIILLALSTSFIIAIFLFINNKRPRYKKYRKDVFSEFQHIMWEWDYDFWGHNIVNIKRYCLNDNTLLVSDQWKSPYQTFFRCETCGSRFGPFRDGVSEIYSRVRRQIDRNIKNNFK